MTDEEIKKISKGFFSKHELECKCGICSGECNIDPEFLHKFTLFRFILNRPVNPTSCYRCKKHLKYSINHDGYAVDVPCIDSQLRFNIIHAAIMAGFYRIGIASNFIHIDCCPIHNYTTLEKVVWIYK